VLSLVFLPSSPSSARNI